MFKFLVVLILSMVFSLNSFAYVGVLNPAQPTLNGYIDSSYTCPSAKACDVHIKANNGQVQLNGVTILSNTTTITGINDQLMSRYVDATDKVGPFEVTVAGTGVDLLSGAGLDHTAIITFTAAGPVDLKVISQSTLTIRFMLTRNQKFVSAEPNLATGKMTLPNTTGLSVGQLIYIVDNDTLEANYYITDITGSVITVSATFNGSAASLTAYTIAKNSQVIVPLNYKSVATTANTENVILNGIDIQVGDKLFMGSSNTTTITKYYVYGLPAASAITEKDFTLKAGDVITTLSNDGLGMSDIYYTEYTSP
jgi:hypothetical protein